MLDDGSLRSLLSVPPLDIVALAWFFLLWAGYNLIVDWILQRPLGLNQHMGLVRGAWMAAMLKRNDRVIDAILIGHLIHSVTFFASTTMLLVAALVGILAAVNQTFDAVMSLSFTVTTTKPLFELKLLLLTGIFVYAFFKFTWSLRQYNYACALVGAMPASLAPGAGPAARPVRSGRARPHPGGDQFQRWPQGLLLCPGRAVLARASRVVHDCFGLDAAGAGAAAGAFAHL